MIKIKKIKSLVITQGDDAISILKGKKKIFKNNKLFVISIK